MPVFNVQKIDQSHSGVVVEFEPDPAKPGEAPKLGDSALVSDPFASSTAEQTWQRVFPDPMPETHELRYQWERTGPKTPRRLRIWPAKKVGAVQAVPVTTASPPAVPVEVKQGDVVPPEILNRLEAMSEAEIESEAPQWGISCYINGRGGKKFTRAQLNAKIGAAMARVSMAAAAT